MTLTARLKRDISKHPAKAGVLGLLLLVMAVFTIKAVVELTPRGASAAPASTITGLPASRPETAGVNAEASESIKESSLLWSKLREVKASGASAQAAFAFDSNFYTPLPDLGKRSAPPVAETKAPVTAPQDGLTPELEEARIKRIREQSRQLIVKSTAVGNGTSQPLAIVNQQMLVVGNTILGFEIVAIRSREVQFRKEGVLVTIKMGDDPRGQ